MNDFIKSDYCTECEGEGFIVYSYVTPLFDGAQMETDHEQCPECEFLHQQEVRADRMHDEMKGN